MTKEKTCYNCGNKNCNAYYSMVKKDYKRHFEIYEYKDFNCVNHDKWKELKEIKEELKQEAEEYFKNLDECKTKEIMIDAYVTGAEPREKQIEELENRLTKAKDVIEKLLNAFASNNFFEEEELSAMEEAEQFLKEK